MRKEGTKKVKEHQDDSKWAHKNAAANLQAVHNIPELLISYRVQKLYLEIFFEKQSLNLVKVLMRLIKWPKMKFVGYIERGNLFS